VGERELCLGGPGCEQDVFAWQGPPVPGTVASSSGTIHNDRRPFRAARPGHHMNTGIPAAHSARF
jgi:hypothetical protein